MTSPSPISAEARALEDAMQGLIDVMRYASRLVSGQRSVDLAGLDQQVGLICAKVLDLPPSEGRALRHHLLRALHEADALMQTLSGDRPSLPPER